VNIKLACQIHDHEYDVGVTEIDKRIADENFLFNMYRLIDRKTKIKVLKVFRQNKAQDYHEMVVAFGRRSFWAKKLEQRRMV
jgi:ABC-type uncharacterized transport system fused permease/ATPase subunit